MGKIDKKTQGKINTITGEIEGIINEHGIDDLESFLGYMSDILCQLDTDIAISVMENFGEEGKHQARCIKVNYGY